MPILPRPARPRALWADLKAFLLGQGRHKLFFAVLAMAMPAIILVGFYFDAAQVGKPKRQIVYVQYYPAGRTDDDIRKKNIADQKILDAARRKRQAEYQRLAKKLGIE